MSQPELSPPARGFLVPSARDVVYELEEEETSIGRAEANDIVSGAYTARAASPNRGAAALSPVPPGLTPRRPPQVIATSKSVSGSHCRILIPARVGARPTLVDAGSTNGKIGRAHV